METIYAVINKLIALFMLVMLGYYIRRKNIVSEKFASETSTFLTKIVLPVFFITTMQISYSPEKLHEGIKIYLFSFVIILLTTVIGFITATLFKIKGADKGIWIYGCMLPNHAFIGFPVMAVLFGEESMFYAAFANAALNTLAFSLGIVIMGLYAQDESKKRSIKELLITPMNVGMVIGIVLFLLDIQLPAPVTESFNMIVNTMSALAMLFVGMVLSKFDIKDLFKGKTNYEITVVRLILIPVCTYFLLLPFRGMLDKVSFGVIVISHALPVGSLVATLAAQYSDNPVSASRYIFTSTLFCVITIPIISLLVI